MMDVEQEIARVIDRRQVLALLGTGAAAWFLAPAAGADSPSSGQPGRCLVFVFLRGAVDGLNVVVPYDEPRYYALRPSIAVAPPGRGAEPALPLGDGFGLHPALAALHPIYRAGELAVIHAVGSPHPTRSHFDAQRFMDTASLGPRTEQGWLARVESELPEQPQRPFSTVCLGSEVARSLWGSEGTLTLSSLRAFDVRSPAGSRAGLASALDAMYRGHDGPAAPAGRSALGALEDVQRIRAELGTSAEGFPPRMAPLADLSKLIRARIGLRIATVAFGGWDTHIGQGGARGQLANRLQELGLGLAALRRELGPEFSRVLVLVSTEFGRTVRENGSRGTDHGHGSVMLLLGGAVRGGKVYGRWPGLEEPDLFEGRDLAVTTDFRDVFHEVAVEFLGAHRDRLSFPHYAGRAARLGLVG